MRRRIVALAAVLALAEACTGGGGEARSPTSEPWRGGTLRIAAIGSSGTISSMSWAGLDPQKDYSGVGWQLFSRCLLRNLFSYNGRPVSEGGAEAQPDLAAGPPEVSADGLAWTIRIKPGIHYAPPLEDVEIVAQDFVRALMRMASPRVTPERCAGCFYTPYYSVIEGFDAYRSGAADTISGLETPAEHTLVVHLTEPAGDLPDRLALPAAAPIPPNPYRPDAVFGTAEGHDRGYGLFLVASGPYMIEGSEDLDPSLPPSEQEPLSGWVDPGHELVLVRNPSWVAATDDLRAGYADRIEVDDRGEWHPAPAREIAEQFVTALEAGTVDHVLDLAYTPGQLRRYRADPEMQGRVTTGTGPFGLVFFIVMKLAVPPFDDLHVRRAVAFAIDRAELRRTVIADPDTMTALRQAVVATHIAPDEIEGNLLASYEPYPTSLERARREMALSRYDHDRDGRCDAPECRGVLAIARTDSLGSAGADQVLAWLAEIGIDLRVELVPRTRFFRRLNDEDEKVPFAMGQSFRYDYLNASTFLPMLFTSPYVGLWNWSLVGATRSQLTRDGYEVTRVPNVDERIDRCIAATGVAQTECWADLDRYLMEEVVPFVPYLASEHTYVVSERVASYSATPNGLALDRIALVPGSE